MDHDLFSLPLKNPILLFSLLLFVILLTPIIFGKLRIPHVIGLILAGMAIGPYGINLMERDASIILFGTVGVMYIMFLTGLEVDISDFVKNKNLSFIFGLLSFSIPFVSGFLAGRFLLELSWPASILLASLLSSHTLVTYPILVRYGITKNRAVNITAGGTIITDVLAFLVLAIIVGVAKGEVSFEFWVRLVVSIIIFSLILIFIVPRISRWFFKKFDDQISQYIFVLGMLFLSAFLAELASMEGIIGAFMAGLTLNRLIPHTSPLMNRIEFVGNSLFIPFFLIGVGMLVNVKILFTSYSTLFTAMVITVVATLAKFIAAYLTQKSCGLNRNERTLIFGLSSPQAAATLAAVMVGYNLIIGKTQSGEAIRLLGEDILNGSILMILITCTIASFSTEKAAKKLAKESAEADTEDSQSQSNSKILVALADQENVNSLVDTALAVANIKRGDLLYGLHVVDDDNTTSKQMSAGMKLVQSAEKYAAGAGVPIKSDIRVDMNITNGVLNAAAERGITDIFMGFHRKITFFSRNVLGQLVENILRKSQMNVYLLNPTQPLGTHKRVVFLAPPLAEKEMGFQNWLKNIRALAHNTGMSTSVYASSATIEAVKKKLQETKDVKPIEYKEFSDWQDFLSIHSELKADDLFICVLARPSSVSYEATFEKIPTFLHKYFKKNSVMMIFPQSAEGNVPGFLKVDRELITPVKEFFKTKFSKIWRRKK